DSILSVIYRLLVDNTFLPANSENAKELDTFIDIGLREVKETNAFGTILFTAFRDFGYFGIIIIPFFLGFVINRLDLKFKLTNNPKYFVFGLLFIYATVFSVYQSVFEGVFWPMYLILFFSINKFRFSN
ncbi:oligosaccharide repeat unit polymerase, partial [Flavobacterium sp.]|uniref:oligosaccharide repeat unit polymerase n=1 Tax=Flavobacterium sp. TaxID=239 RepID=UPI002ED7F105